MRQLYVTTNCSTPTLIGILTELKPGPNEPYGQRGEYQFEYTLGKIPPKEYLKIEHFPDMTTIYTGSNVLKWLANYLPASNGKRFFETLLKTAGLTEYDEWEWLKSMGQRNVNTNVLLFDEIPKEIIRYDR